ncbi:MAG: hemin uptake protein HemP [Betaproteobacteria bacterium]|nr:MAG: hemin uptake protein HemP [Betaproteobacteria bacterium]
MSPEQCVQRIPPRQAVGAGGAGRKTPRVPSSELLGERGELLIEHHGREYRLRLTQSGKLILTA